MRAWMAETVLPLLAAALVLFGLAALGRLASASVQQQGRYTSTFGQISCEPPPGLKRAEFLREVQYEADLPDRLDLFDRSLSSRLRNAFAQHALVEGVERIEVRPGQRVQVQLRHRKPVLVISLGNEVRVVDRHGVLLPHAVESAGLPALRGKVTRGVGRTGTVCSNAAVLAAAATAGFLLPQQDRLQLAELAYHNVGNGLCAVPEQHRGRSGTARRPFPTAAGEVILWTTSGSRLCWGSPPGAEPAGEATAVLKRDRLLRELDQRAEAGQGEQIYEQDLRPAARAWCRPLCQGVQVGVRSEP